MTALYTVAAFVAAIALIAFGSWVLRVYREEIARPDWLVPDPAFSLFDTPRHGGRRQFTGRGAYDEVVEPGSGMWPAGTQGYEADGTKVTDRAVIAELMSGPVASYGKKPTLVPSEQKRRDVGPNTVSEPSADGRVVPFARPARHVFDPPKSRTDANAPMSPFGLGSTRRSDPVYNRPTSYPRLSAPKKEPPKPKREIPEYMHVAADNGRVPSIRRNLRAFAAYGKLRVVA